MIDPEIKDIRREVIYKPPHSINPPKPDEWESGIITTFNAAYVFVLYNGDKTPKATRRGDLFWATAGD